MSLFDDLAPSDRRSRVGVITHGSLGAGVEMTPDRNRADVEEIKDETLEGLDVTYVKRIDEALDLLLDAEPTGDPAAMYDVPDLDRAPEPAVVVVLDAEAPEPVVQ